MIGPEHYAEAERLLSLAESCDWTTEVAPYRDPALAAAQVHATLALAAATAEGAHDPASGPLVSPPSTATPPHLAYPGNEWGRAIYGEVSA